MFTHLNYVAQAPFRAPWNNENHQMQRDEFSSPFDNSVNEIAAGRPQFYPGPWGSCSTTCGPGIATRTVECIALQGITSNVIKLPDYECEGITKPAAFQPCQLQQCPLNEVADDPATVRERSLSTSSTFKWDYGEWTACSASCLGGKQRSTLKCVDVKRQNAVAWSFCDAKQRPVDLTRSCNNDPCPPEWDVGEMSECSHTCGGGLRTRKVRCIRRISRSGGAESTLILPDGQCLQPKPESSKACGLVDCAATWKIGDWSLCSTSCGPGEQRREVACEQRVATGEVKQFHPPIQCRHVEKPPTVQLCDLGTCNVSSYFVAQNNNKFATSMPNLLHHDYSRKLTLNVGGSAKLFLGTSLKVKCPVRNYAKNKIIWTKNGKPIENNAHVKISSNGALRIFHATMKDAGLYACIANGVQGNVTLSFKPRNNLEDELENDSRSMLSKNLLEDEIDADPAAVDFQLIQKVRESLKKNHDIRMFDRLADVTEPGNIKVDYATGDWSKCSHTECGGSGGAQIRQLKCRLSYQGSVGYLDDDICESFGVNRPPSSRSCLPSHCPRWQTSRWSECSMSRCIRHATSIQKREVKCAYINGTAAPFHLCEKGSRPKVKKECVNVNCTAEWRSSVWGQCSRTCGDGGVQMRILRCIWRGTRKPAGRNCQSSLRPPAIRSCDKSSGSMLSSCPKSLKGASVSSLLAFTPRPLFKGWERWRGWRLYNWESDESGNLRRRI